MASKKRIPSQRVCSNTNCNRAAEKRGFCNAHYKRWLKGADMDAPFRKRSESGLCLFPGCGKPLKARDLCNAHYKRWLKGADMDAPFATPAGSGLQTIRESIDNPTDGCLIWPYGRSSNGYAIVWHEGAQVQAARVALILSGHPPPFEGAVLRHVVCGNGHLGCYNFQHCDWGTYKQNSADMVRHGTHLAGERNKKAKLTSAQVLEIYALRPFWIAKKVRTAEVALQYGVHKDTIVGIWQGRCWLATTAHLRELNED